MNEEAIFAAAIEKNSPEERAAFLDQACGDDAELRHRVEGLLKAYDQPDAFLENPLCHAAETVDRASLDEQPGAMIGRYKLLQELGEGGMGTVFMAEQTHPVKRRVAVKIIKHGMDSRQFIARFEAERQALAMMDHPNIAHVLDAGCTETGRPYFVMELVKGVPITDYCNQHDLATRERLKLFVPVCQAVQHAHQKGIIHRDIKPSNVMIAEYDGRPVPKVIDFGVAKATEQQLTEKTAFTGFGQIVGTLEYMSPEQATLNQLDIDTRSDIYSLGVLLYELLTGETPFDRQRLSTTPFDETLRIIREEELPRPSDRVTTLQCACTTECPHCHGQPRELIRTLRGELDWIVMKALEKDRTRRYETAGSLCDDVERYLSDEPVEACPPSAAYRFTKFVRRNKGAIFTAGLVAAALLIGSVVSTWQAIRATHAAVAQQRAHEEADRAWEAESEQRRLAEESARTAQENEARATANARRAAENYEVARRAVEQMLTRVADKRLGNAPEMNNIRRRLLNDALAFYTDLVKLNPEDAIAYYERAKLHERLHEFEKARTDYEKAIDLEPDNAEFHTALGRHCVACEDAAKVDLPCAALHIEKALQLRPEDCWLHHDLAYIYMRMGERKKSQMAFLRSADLTDSAIDAYLLRARACYAVNDFQGAVAWEKKALLLGPDFATIHYHLSGYYLRLGRYEETIAAASKAIQRYPKYEGGSRSEWERFYYHLYIERGDAYAQLKLYRHAAEDYAKVSELAPFYREIYKKRALVKFRLEDYDGALDDIAKSVQQAPDDTGNLESIPLQLVAHCPDDHFRQGMLALADKTIQLTEGSPVAHVTRARLYAALGQPEKALADFNEAVKLDAKSPVGWTGRGEFFANRGQWEKARADFDKAIELEPGSARDCNALARCLAIGPDRRLWRPDVSVELAGKAVQLAIKEGGEGINWGLGLLHEEGMYWNTLGAARDRAGQWEAAVEALMEAMNLRAGGDARDWFPLAMAHWQLGKHQEARDWYDKAVAWMIENEPEDDEIPRFHREASALLGVPDTLPEQTLKTDPQQAELHHQRGLLFLEADDLEKAASDLTRAAELQPANVGCWTELLAVRHRQENDDAMRATVDLAIQSIEKHMTDSGQQARALRELGERLLTLGQAEHGTAVLTRSVESWKKHAEETSLDLEANWLYARTLVRLGGVPGHGPGWPGCDSQIEAILEPMLAGLKPGDLDQGQLAQAYSDLGSVRGRQGRLQEARELLLESIRLNPTEKWTQKRLAVVYLNSVEGCDADPKKAVRHTITALKLAGDNESQFRETCQQAVDALRQWLSAAGDNDPEGHYLLAIATAHLHRPEEAQDYWKRAEEILAEQGHEPAETLRELREEARLLLAAGEESNQKE